MATIDYRAQSYKEIAKKQAPTAQTPEQIYSPAVREKFNVTYDPAKQQLTASGGGSTVVQNVSTGEYVSIQGDASKAQVDTAHIQGMRVQQEAAQRQAQQQAMADAVIAQQRSQEASESTGVQLFQREAAYQQSLAGVQASQRMGQQPRYMVPGEYAEQVRQQQAARQITQTGAGPKGQGVPVVPEQISPEEMGTSKDLVAFPYVKSLVRGAGKVLYGPNVGTVKPLIDVGQGTVFGSENLVTDPDVQTLGLTLGLGAAPRFIGLVVGAGFFGAKANEVYNRPTWKGGGELLEFVALPFIVKGGEKLIAKGKTAYANLKEMSYISPKGNVGVRVKVAQTNEPYVGARQDMASQKYPADWWTEVSRASEASKLTDTMLRSTIKAPATPKTRSEAMILSEVRTGQRDVITAPNTVRKAFIRELAAQEGITKTDKFMTRAFPYDNFYYPMRSGRPVQDAAYFQRQYTVMNRGSYLAGLRQLGYNTAGAIPLRGSTYGVEPSGYTQAMRVYLAQQIARNIAAKRQFFIMEKAPGSGINPLSASKPAQVKPSVSKGYTEVTDNMGRVQLVRMAPLKQVTLQKVKVKQKAIPKMFTVQAQAQKQQQVQILEQVAVQKPTQTMDQVVGQASIQKQGLNQILGLKQEQTQKTLQKQVLLQQTVQKQKQGQITGQQQILIQEPVPRQEQKQQQLLGSVQILRQETVQEQEQLQKPKTVQILRIEQIPKQRVIQRTKQIIEEVVIPKKTKASKMYEPRMNSIGRTKPSSGFRAFARRGGKWRAISGSVTEESALDIGAGYVKGGLAASFKIAPINEAPAKSVSTGMFQKFAGSFRSYEIRRGIARPTPNQYIEKRGTRLSTRSERGAIRQAKQNKQVKTRWL